MVCTAGINEKGEWRRIYPIPFRNLPELEKYKKYQWVEMELEKTSDQRPESYKNKGEIKLVVDNPIDTKNNWQKRKDILFENTPIFNDLETIIKKAHCNKMSLCIFKPTKITDFKIEETSGEWNQEILKSIKNENDQLALFENFKKEIKLVKKLPYKFSYQFEDVKGKKSTLMIEDWEIGQLYWNCLKKSNNDEKEAIKKVKKKYKDDFLAKKDIYLFLGTTREFHRRKAKNPYVITGVFYPPKTENFLF